MSVSLQDVLARLTKVARSGHEYKARCPAHDDKRESLTVKSGDDGRVLLYCHAGCDFRAIRDALGLGQGATPSPRGRREVATYPYRDESGTMLYEVVRFEPKDFRPRKPDGTWSLKGVRRVPYRLPQLRTACAAGRAVFVVEGEKDVDALAHVKLCATTIAGGCKGTWPDDLASFFKGAARVVILPDNDPPGREFGDKVGRALHAAGLAVHVLELPGLPEKGDVSDWLSASGTAEQLKALAKEAPSWAPNAGAVIAPAPLAHTEDRSEDFFEGLTGRPVLEDAALYGVLGDYVRAVGPHTEAHPAGILFSLLAAVGAWIGRAPHVLLDGSRHGASLFALLVGPTAAARKGTTWSHARGLLRAADPDFVRDRVKGGLSSGEGLIDALTPPPSPDGEVASVPDTRLVIVETEFAAVLAKKRREGNTLSQALRQAWDGETLAVMTVRKTGAPARVVMDPHVSLLGHVTRDELAGMLDGNDVSNGFLNRFALVYVERTKLLPDGGQLPPEELRNFGETLNARAVDARKIGDVGLTPAARVVWRGLYSTLSVGDGDLTARAAPIVRRIAMLLAVLDGERSVDVRHLVAASAAWRYCEASARYVLPGKGLSLLAQRFRESITQAGSVGVPHRQLWRVGGSNNRPATEIHAAVRELLNAGMIVTEQEPSPRGRPAHRHYDARVRLHAMGMMGKRGINPTHSSHHSHNSYAVHTEAASGRDSIGVIEDVDEEGNPRQSLTPERIAALFEERRRRQESGGGLAA